MVFTGIHVVGVSVNIIMRYPTLSDQGLAIWSERSLRPA